MSHIVIGKSGSRNVSIDLKLLMQTRLLMTADSGGGKTMQRVDSILSGPELKILAVLTELHGEAISRSELAERSGYAAGGGAFGNPLGALRTKGLIEYVRQGQVKAADWLFI